jgi:hypothetical protein
MKSYTILLSLLLVSFVANSQVLILTLSSLTSTPEGNLARSLKGEWIIAMAEIDGDDVLDQFKGVRLNFPKCKNKDFKAGNCPPIEVTGDENTDYFKALLGEDPKFSIKSRKEINKTAKAEDAEFEKVKYEVITTDNSEFEYSFKYKKKVMYISTIGEAGSESFQLVRPPKEKKK